MSVGHGQLGLIDLQRTYSQLAVDSGHRKPFLDVDYGLEIDSGSWTDEGGFVWSTVIDADDLSRGGVGSDWVRPIVDIEVSIGVRKYLLTRVERLADLIEGSWYYDDDLLERGGTTTLYVHLPNKTDAPVAIVVMLIRFSFAVQSEVHPLLGLEKLANADFEGGSFGGVPTGWTSLGSGHAIETVIVEEGLRAAKVTSASFANGSQNGWAQSLLNVAGKLYRWAIYYWTPPEGLAAGVTIRCRVAQSGGPDLTADGRNFFGSTHSFPVRETFGEWRRLTFDYMWADPSDGTVYVHLYLENNSGSAKPGTLIVDGATCRRIHRFVRYVGGLDGSSIPSMKVAAKSLHFKGNTVALGDVRLLNGDDQRLHVGFAGLYHFNKPARVSVGGSFHDGSEVLADDWRAAFSAITGSPTFERSGIGIPLTNAHDLALILANPRRYMSQDTGALDENRERAIKPFVFGQSVWHNGSVTVPEHLFKPVRVDLTGNGYAAYEYADGEYPIGESTDMVIPEPGVFLLKVYPNEECAEKDVLGREVSITITSNTVANPTIVTTAEDHGLVTGNVIFIWGVVGSNPTINGTRTVTAITAQTFSVPVNVNVSPGTGGKFVNTGDYSMSLRNTRLTVLRDIQNMRFDKDGKDRAAWSLDFNIGGATLAVNTQFEGPPYRVAAYLARLMNAVAGVANITVTYSETTHKFTVARGSGTLQLIMIGDPAAADRAHQQSWKNLGFNVTANKTGSLTYTSDFAIFNTPEENHIVRMTGAGYKDNALGSITGVAGQALEYAAEIYVWLWVYVLNQPMERVMLGEFRAARTAQFNAFEKLFMVIDSTLEEGRLIDYFDALCQVGAMTVNIDGNGMLRCRRHVNGITDGVRDIYQHDVKSIVMWKDKSQVYKESRILGSWHPAHGEFKSGLTDIVNGDGVQVRYGTEAIFEVPGFVSKDTVTGGVCILGTAYGVLTSQVPRIITLVVAGKLKDMMIGQKIRVTYEGTEILSSTGRLDAVVFRLVAIEENYYGDTTAVAVENIDWITGVGGGGSESDGGGGGGGRGVSRAGALQACNRIMSML